VDTLQLEATKLDTLPLDANSSDESSPPLPGENEIHAQTAALIQHLMRGSRAIEQRTVGRYAFPKLVRLVPIGKAGDLLDDEAVVAVGKNVSFDGMCVFHQQPLPYRHVLACIDMDADTSFQIPLDLHWCRFTRLGWYESGGRFSAHSGVATPSLSGSSLVPRDRSELLP
jgi:hypothetical protein